MLALLIGIAAAYAAAWPFLFDRTATWLGPVERVQWPGSVPADWPQRLRTTPFEEGLAPAAFSVGGPSGAAAGTWSFEYQGPPAPVLFAGMSDERPGRTETLVVATSEQAELSYSYAQVALGWPVRTVATNRLAVDSIGPGGTERQEVRVGWWYRGVPILGPSSPTAVPAGSGPGGGWDEVRIPLRPVWPGFAIVVGTVAGLLYLPPRAVRLVRGWVRRRRGACAACGYPRGESAVCTECGAKLPADR